MEATLALILVWGSSCVDQGLSTVTSTEIETGQISAKHWIDLLDDGSLEALSSMRLAWDCPGQGSCAKDTPYLEIVEPDRLTLLTATASSRFEPVVEDEIRLIYLARIAADTAVSSASVVFERSSGQFDSRADFPEPFEIIFPAEGASFSRKEGFTIEVSGTLSSVHIAGPCIEEWTRISWPFGTLDDFPAGPFEPEDGHEEESCTATITAYRSRTGVVDAAFDPETSSIEARQRRTTTITLTP